MKNPFITGKTPKVLNLSKLSGLSCGAPSGTRTRDTLINRQTLYRLSYRRITCVGKVATLHNVSLIVMACSVDQTGRVMNPRIRQTDKFGNGVFVILLYHLSYASP